MANNLLAKLEMMTYESDVNLSSNSDSDESTTEEEYPTNQKSVGSFSPVANNSETRKEKWPVLSSSSSEFSSSTSSSSSGSTSSSYSDNLPLEIWSRKRKFEENEQFESRRKLDFSSEVIKGKAKDKNSEEPLGFDPLCSTDDLEEEKVDRLSRKRTRYMTEQPSPICFITNQEGFKLTLKIIRK